MTAAFHATDLLAADRFGPQTRPGSPWLGVAEEVAGTLAEDAGARDVAGAPPFAEVELLRSSGLLGLWIPAAAGGSGTDLATTFAALRILARADGSIAHLLGYHLNFCVGTLGDAAPETANRLWRDTLRHGWLWASTGSPQDAPMRLEPDGTGWRLNGSKTFATGSRVADRIVGFVRSPADDHDLVVVLDPSRPELVRRDDWDPIGQRLTASDGLELHDYPLAAEDVVIDYGPAEVPRGWDHTLGVLFSQLLFSHLCLGMAEGALAVASAYRRSASRPWFHADVSDPGQDPYVLGLLGELTASSAAVAALNDRATAGLSAAYDRGAELTAEHRAAVAELIAATRIAANRTALDVAARVFELAGARATARARHLDLAWRNIRTLTLHDPTAYKQRELGDYVLNGTAPTPSPYR
ncbi:alkylation response protein AidB-like acyl-CoA dehydrogenase [Friedmanniella endophytica]|uniref:Alkylation response protein AidB-like acyl-CoA dehydrogenase n=1 Tax=Microlunatus kandeliicorticis TaxID=1759536 RepID=A0A7W3P4P4_9ACTN|nr:acyl-CoA dehydrogenase family protein [Microlunatus kandeliicorticis]MBA8793035.1 alkylation response protein AidB-like acyl-CoA dehydrogenase [Microlunatus kandeliicorticis]